MSLSQEPPVADDLGAISAEQFRQILAMLSSAVAQSASPKPDQPKYLTVQDAAAYCRVAVQTIYNNRRYIARLPGLRKLLFTRESLDSWLATRRSARRSQS